MSNQYRSVLASGGAGTGGDAVAANVLAGKTFTNDNGFDTGTMVNNGAVSGSATPSTPYTIPEGYHNGSGTVTASYPSGAYEFIGAQGYNAVASFTFNSAYVAGDVFIVTADSVTKLPSTITGFTATDISNGRKFTATGTGSSIFVQLSSSGGGGVTHLRPL